MEVEKEEGSSLPPNYITILQLKERWLQQQQNPNVGAGDALGRVPLLQNPNLHRVNKQIIPEEVAVDDSSSRNQADAAADNENDKTADHSNSKLSKKKKKKSSRAPNPRDENPPLLVPEADKRTLQVGGRRSRHPNHKMTTTTTILQDDDVDDLSHNDVDAPAPSDGIIEPVATAIVIQRANRNRKPKHKPKSNDKMTTPLALTQNVDDLSHNNDAPPDHGVVKANRKGVAGRFQGKPKPNRNRPSESFLFPLKKGQTSLVWVKKGESSAN